MATEFMRGITAAREAPQRPEILVNLREIPVKELSVKMRELTAAHRKSHPKSDLAVVANLNINGSAIYGGSDSLHYLHNQLLNQLGVDANGAGFGISLVLRTEEAKTAVISYEGKVRIATLAKRDELDLQYSAFDHWAARILRASKYG